MPEPFELIAADAGRRRVAGRVEIGVEKVVRERPHGQPRRVDMLEQHLAVAHDRDRRMQRMGLAAQRRELRPRAGAIGRLGEAPLAERQRLVGAEHQAAGILRRHRLRLFARQQRRDLAGIRDAGAALRPRARRYRPARSRPECPRASSRRAAPRFSKRAPADRGASQSGMSSRHRLPAALGQQLHHRRGGFLDRAARHVDDRPVVLAAELARERDLLGHRLAVDILVVVVLRAAGRAGGSAGSARSARGWR